MSAAVDREGIGPTNLVEAIDRIQPSTDESLPAIPGIRTLATHVNGPEGVDDQTIESVFLEIDRLLAHDRLAAHQLATAAAVALVDTAPETAADLVDHLFSLVAEDATKRRSLFTIEYVSTVAPAAVGPHVETIIEHLDDPREAVARHAAGVVLAVARGAPDDLSESVPALIERLEDSFDGVDERRITSDLNDVREFERDRRRIHELSRSTIARATAAVAQSRPEQTVRAVLDSDTEETLVSLLTDDYPRVRAAAVGVLSHVAEADPEPFESATGTVVELLDDEHQVVRGGAIFTLRALETPEALEGLRYASQNESVAELRELAETAVREQEGSS